MFDDLEVKFDVEDGDQVMEAINKLIEPPQVLIMDIDMKRQNGIETTKMVKTKFPNTIVLMLTVSENNEDILKAFEVGASGYLLKGEKPMKMYDFIQHAVQGNLSLSDAVLRQSMDLLVQQATTFDKPKPSDFGLTNRELSILKLIAKGLDYHAIAEHLFISPQTVRSHTDNIYKKLDVHSKVEAAKLVLLNHW